jgi:hypothetical protein
VRALRKLIRIGRRERALLARAFALLVLARCALRLVSFERVRSLFDKVSSKPRLPGCPPEAIRWAVLAAAQRLPGTRCLPRALVLQALLRDAGLNPALRIGVARDAGGGLMAHAWVECEGRPVLEHEDMSTYSPLSPLVR